MSVKPLIRRRSDSWAYVLRINRGWWGLCSSGDSIYLDLGMVRVMRRNGWTPLFTEVRKFGPIQWWRFNR